MKNLTETLKRILAVALSSVLLSGPAMAQTVVGRAASVGDTCGELLNQSKKALRAGCRKISNSPSGQLTL